ncbi:MAG TPA: GNAT family N-acetyltransferase [Acidimicrobiia bacterium]|jgi:GNAT superfamily N-acetyltransferase|nr:GNAT family N-acetyltransferase [Acidimicrobiia bacterium]
MAVVRFEDPEGFRAAIDPLIRGSEARHNLMHGILGTLIDDPSVYEEHRLWLVARNGAPVAAAMRTPPWKLILADGADQQAAAELAAGIAADPEDPPGAIGNRPTVDWFVEAWSQSTGDTVDPHMAQGVFALESVTPQPHARGAPRMATSSDADLIVDWFEQFSFEAIPEEPVDRDRYASAAARLIERRRGTGVWLWDRDAQVVSLSAHGNPTPSGMRIGPVYTPPEHRGRGYATALVAHQSAQLLASGRRFCFLFTDLANPTSNAIYQRIGYKQIAESMDYGFAAGADRG